jgi:hypothetical protein
VRSASETLEGSAQKFYDTSLRQPVQHNNCTGLQKMCAWLTRELTPFRSA